MKIFKFPGARLVDHDHINTTKIRNVQKSPSSKSPKGQSQQFKKSGSLDLTYYHARRYKQLEKVYRANSCDKKFRTKSSSSSKSVYDLKSFSRPLYSKNQPKKQLLHPEKKIFLKTQKKTRGYFNDLRSCIQLLCQRLTRCLQTKSEKIFTEQYNEAFKIYQIADSKQNDNYVVGNLVNVLRKCQQKRNQKKMQANSDKISQIQKDKSSLAIQLRKIKLKQQVLNQELKKITDKNNQLLSQIKKQKQRKQRKYVNQFTQTNSMQINYNESDNNILNSSLEVSKLIQTIRSLKQKQNYMNILITQLQKDGVNLQKIYKRALRNRQRQLRQNNEDQQSQTQKLSQSYSKYIKSHTKNIQHDEHDNKYKKQLLKTKNDGSLADDSIIDQIQALSFNYDQKQDSMQIYTPKNIYICHKQMDATLKKQLQLDFNCLYQQQESNENDQYGSEGFQTI